MHPDRPRLTLPRTRFESFLEIAAGLGLVVIVAALATTWSRLPDQVPYHFNAAGEPDAWGGRGWVFAPPAVALVLYVGLGFLARFPHAYNYLWAITTENAPRQYLLARQMTVSLKAVMVWTFAIGYWNNLRTAIGEADGLGSLYLPVMLGLITVVLLVFIAAMYRAR